MQHAAPLARSSPIQYVLTAGLWWCLEGRLVRTEQIATRSRSSSSRPPKLTGFGLRWRLEGRRACVAQVTIWTGHVLARLDPLKLTGVGLRWGLEGRLACVAQGHDLDSSLSTVDPVYVLAFMICCARSVSYRLLPGTTCSARSVLCIPPRSQAYMDLLL